MDNKKELIIMIGIPGAGKSYYVNKNLSSSYQVICADDIRKALGFVFEKKMESLIHCIAETYVKSKMERGLSIVIDETNIGISHILKWKILAEDYGYTTKGIMVDTPVEICKERRGCNEGRFPEEVIDIMNNGLNRLKKENLNFYFGSVYVIKGT